MAQGFILPMGRRRYWDADGEILAFGKVYFYEAGSTTPLDTWSNSDLTSLNTNPVILSASGECTVFVAQGDLYKEDLFDANDVHQTGYPVDGVEALPAPDPPAPTPSPVPVGGIIAYGGTSAPSGYLLCNGALVTRATYADLFTAIGEAYGAGDGVTTFGLPDLQQRFPMGKASSGTGNTLGGTGGLIDHVHTGPSHTHTTLVTWTHTHNVTVAAHTHTLTSPRDGWGSTLNTPSVGSRLVTGDSTTPLYQASADQSLTTGSGGAINQSTDAASPDSSTFASGSSGTGSTGTANPPYQTVNYIIKT